MHQRIRESHSRDLPFLQEMLHEAVFWRAGADMPSLTEGLAYPDVAKSLEDWGDRDGDTGVVATVDSTPVGASWCRLWTDDDHIRGFVDEATPVLVIGVHRDHLNLVLNVSLRREGCSPSCTDLHCPTLRLYQHPRVRAITLGSEVGKGSWKRTVQVILAVLRVLPPDMSAVVFATRRGCAIDALASICAATSVYFLLDELQSSLAVIGRIAWIE